MNSYFQVLPLIATVVLIYWEFLTDFCTYTNTHCVSRWRVAAAALISQILSGSLDFAYFCDFSIKIFYMKLSRFPCIKNKHYLRLLRMPEFQIKIEISSYCELSRLQALFSVAKKIDL